MKKRILILANNDIGLYNFRKDLILKLIDLGNDLYISLPYGDMIEPLTELGCKFLKTPIDRRGINPIIDFKLIYKYFHLLKNVNPDLVITYTIKPNIYGGFLCRMMKIPYAVNITGLGTAFEKNGLLKSIATILYKISLKKVEIVFFENIENMMLFRKLKICVKNTDCKLLHGAGVDLRYFTYTEYPLEDDIVHFLFIGRIMKEKGVEELFSVMERLNFEGKKCVLDMLGGFEENYLETIEEKKKEGWLNYYGYQKDVRPFIKKSHCFVLPSWHEGMANTNLECAAMGRPLITSDIHGCKESIIDGKSGFLCEPKNPESLYKAMTKFLALTRQERVLMGKIGRKHMEDEFDKKNVVLETVKSLCFDKNLQ